MRYTCGMEVYRVKPLRSDGPIEVSVPASKSILNRALLLSAFTGGSRLYAGSYGEDTRVLLSCLQELGAVCERLEDGFAVRGGKPNKRAVLDVGSAGTAARFLTAILAFSGGDYEMHASPQMERRPMGLVETLAGCGVRFEFLKERGRFPFRMHSDGIAVSELTVDVSESTQYASGILLAAALSGRNFTLHLTGERSRGSYLRMTLAMLSDFGSSAERRDDSIFLTPSRGTPFYRVEPDLSGACYFYALSLLLGRQVLVRDVHLQTLQGDRKFLDLLAEKGVSLTDTPKGVLADGRGIPSYGGFDCDLGDFSDQALTVAALAPFADTPSALRGIGHIRRQECDRIRAIVENLSALGVPCRTDGENVFIEPAPVRGGRIRTYGDHRVAMAFSLVGLKCGGVTIEDPACCRKTFENFFDLLDTLQT